MKLPRVSAFRLVGPPHAKGRVKAPAPLADDAEAVLVALGPEDAADVAAVARALPDPEGLPAGTLVVVLPLVAEPPSLASRVLSALGRGRTVARAERCSALLARGYVELGAGTDAETNEDLAWGRATGPGSEP